MSALRAVQKKSADELSNKSDGFYVAKPFASFGLDDRRLIVNDGPEVDAVITWPPDVPDLAKVISGDRKAFQDSFGSAGLVDASLKLLHAPAREPIENPPTALPENLNMGVEKSSRRVSLGGVTTIEFAGISSAPRTCRRSGRLEAGAPLPRRGDVAV